MCNRLISRSLPRRKVREGTVVASGIQGDQGTQLTLRPQLLVENGALIHRSRTQEKESWASTCQAGGKYYLTRNGSTIIAFAIGKKWKVSGHNAHPMTGSSD